MATLTRRPHDLAFRPAADPQTLRAFLPYHLLTREQLQRLRFGDNDEGYVRNQVARLVSAGYLKKTALLPHPSGKGAAPVYQLGARGRQWLTDQGYPVQLKEFTIKREAPLRHLVHVNDFLIAVELFVRSSPFAELAEMRHDIDLKKQPFTTVVDGRRLYYTPDTWLDLRFPVPDGEYQECFVVEIDRGTEDQRRWREKIRALLAWKTHAYEEQFGTRNLTVAVVAVCGDDQVETDAARAKRVQNLKRWTEAEMHNSHESEEAADFYFLAADPARLDPQAAFCAPLWSRTFSDDFLPLLAVIENGSLEVALSEPRESLQR